MYDFSRRLGDAVKQARERLHKTQDAVAAAIGVDVRTILNIENYKGNPKMVVLFPLLRYLSIDPREVFYPEMERESPALQQLRLMLEDCSEEEAKEMLPVVQSILSLLRNRNSGSL